MGRSWGHLFKVTCFHFSLVPETKTAPFLLLPPNSDWGDAMTEKGSQAVEKEYWKAPNPGVYFGYLC